MDDQTEKLELAGQTRTLQVVCGGLIAGCLLLLGVVFVLTSTGAVPAAGTAPILTCIGAGMSVACIVARATVPAVITTRARKALVAGNLDRFPVLGGKFQPHAAEAIAQSGDKGRLAAVYGSQTIVGMAILEGCCFINLIFYLIEQHPLAIAIALVMLVLMALSFPSRSRMAGWVANQLRWTQQESAFGR